MIIVCPEVNSRVPVPLIRGFVPPRTTTTVETFELPERIKPILHLADHPVVCKYCGPELVDTVEVKLDSPNP